MADGCYRGDVRGTSRLGLAAGFAVAIGVIGGLAGALWSAAFGLPGGGFELFSDSGNGEGVMAVFLGAVGGLATGALLGWFLPDYRDRPRLGAMVLGLALVAAVPLAAAAGSVGDLTNADRPPGLRPYVAILALPVSLAATLAIRRRLRTAARS